MVIPVRIFGWDMFGRRGVSTRKAMDVHVCLTNAWYAAHVEVANAVHRWWWDR